MSARAIAGAEPQVECSEIEGRAVVPGSGAGPVLLADEPLSFWGGVDPATGRVIDTHHPLLGKTVSGSVLVMPTSRGSCSGSGVLLDLILRDRGPAALVFCEDEDVLTLGALVAKHLFGRNLPVIQLGADAFAALAASPRAEVHEDALLAGALCVSLCPLSAAALDLTPTERDMLAGGDGPATREAIRIVIAMALKQGARRLVDVRRAHIDGCIYASPANLTFAERMVALGARVIVPTTTNAISVDLAHWRAQGVPDAFGSPAARLAEAYLAMGCAPSFTCAPQLLPDAPCRGEVLAWAESNAVVFANSVIGARSAKHPDFLDLCMAVTGRAPLAGVYLDEGRRPGCVIEVEAVELPDDAFWPLLGWVAGRRSGNRIPLLTGLDATNPDQDDLKALCAAFGTTAGAAMLHVAGVTPESGVPPLPGAERIGITRAELRSAWASLNDGPEAVDLVAIGSPHASSEECRRLATVLDERQCRVKTRVMVMVGRATLADIAADGTLARLSASGVTVLPDLCWCSITEPVFPPDSRTVVTTSGKYAHYGPGLSGRAVRLASLSECAKAALTGRLPPATPDWLR